MEKRKPSRDLAAFQAAFLRDAAITMTALRSAIALGYGLQDVQEVVARMVPRHFVKSVTSHANHRQWQDVYHLPFDDRVLYIKFTDAIVTEFILLSLKEK